MGRARALVLHTTRHVSLSEAGQSMLEDARAIVAQAAALEARLQAYDDNDRMQALRVGAIDSATIGLVPQLLTWSSALQRRS